ncbi:PTS fructose transporter subunit IIB [Marinilactibacillus psychrotolerans]|uniref:PTS fructose transporter subunit IIB n=1 Tax=Marinilactibacillus psychrotolerans TaxID=191770 RepID=A0A5R9C3D6_9LACT|nr:PTS fructose transporter subunit IIB [Marinilactibacillus psychrotolerans]TLQ07300.1 PTS fructose transporter subunit IIB [Marinilactibacillus psychrotolerans]
MNIVAVTACATGVAHTFMAKRALEDAAAKQGYQIKVETQGATGIENELTQSEVDQADIVILAVEVGIAKRERFEKVKKVEIPISTAIKNADGLLEKIKEKLQT